MAFGPIAASALTAVAYAGVYATHSLLASVAAKDYVQARLPWLYPRYRLAYNLLQAALFALAITLQERYAAPIAFFEVGSTGALLQAVAGWVVLGVGVVGMLACFGSYRAAEFLGFERFRHRRDPGRLETTGLHKMVRHPLYLFTTLAVCGAVVLVPALTRFAALAVYFVYLPIGTAFEERKLVGEFGTAYTEYQKRVPSGVPFFKG